MKKQNQKYRSSDEPYDEIYNSIKEFEEYAKENHLPKPENWDDLQAKAIFGSTNEKSKAFQFAKKAGFIDEDFKDLHLLKKILDRKVVERAHEYEKMGGDERKLAVHTDLRNLKRYNQLNESNYLTRKLQFLAEIEKEFIEQSKVDEDVSQKVVYPKLLIDVGLEEYRDKILEIKDYCDDSFVCSSEEFLLYVANENFKPLYDRFGTTKSKLKFCIHVLSKIIKSDTWYNNSVKSIGVSKSDCTKSEINSDWKDGIKRIAH